MTQASTTTDWSPKSGDEILADVQRALDSVRPQPFFASFSGFSADKAKNFTTDGIQYIVAHPLFWKQIPISPAPIETLTHFAGIQIIDLDDPRNTQVRVNVLNAMAEAMGLSCE